MILDLFYFKKKLDTIVDPQNKHTIVDQGCSWTTPLKNCLSAVFNWVLKKVSYIFWKLDILRIPKEWS